VTLRVEDLSVSFRTQTVVDGVSFELQQGEILGLAGESGSGKSMTITAILGLAAALGARVTGSVRLDDQELVGRTQREMLEVRGSRIATVLQNPTAAFNPVFRIGSVFRTVLRRHGATRAEADARSIEAMKSVLLPTDLLARYPHQVSGGQAQRAAIALALALKARVLLADEPTSALDVTVQGEVLDLLRDLRDEHGMAVLFVSHDLAVVAELCARIAVMRRGRIVETGDTAQTLTKPAHDYTRRLAAAVPKLQEVVEPC
jgi:ABC-type glutathione transport system ATPase component